MDIMSIINEQKEVNEQLASIFINNKIKSFRLISLGNSIASGYSMVRTTKPLLLRNQSLPQMMIEGNIDIDIHHFARSQNNNDEHILDWILTNIKESEMHRLNRIDYSDSLAGMPTNGLNINDMDIYYPLIIENDRGLQDLITESRSNMANIIIYNGCTGSFLDNLTRGGNKIISGINRDLISLEAILKFINLNNRSNHGETQIYISGVPNFLGLGLSEFINCKLKKIVQDYPNATYLEPIKTRFFYPKYNPTNFKDKYTLKTDIHYDEIEYLKYNNIIIKSIINNYLINKSLIQVDRDLYKISSNIEIEQPELISDDNYIKQMILKVILDESLKMPENQKKRFYQKSKQYLINRFPYDFYYLKKNNLKQAYKIIR